MERIFAACVFVGGFLTTIAPLELFYGHAIVPTVFGFLCATAALITIAEEVMRRKNA